MAGAKATPKTRAKSKNALLIRVDRKVKNRLDTLVENHQMTGGPKRSYSWAINEALSMSTGRDVRGFLLDTGTDLLRRLYPRNEDWQKLLNYIKIVGLQPHLRAQAKLALSFAVAPAPITSLEGDEMTLEEEVREAISRIDIDIID